MLHPSRARRSLPGSRFLGTPCRASSNLESLVYGAAVLALALGCASGSKPPESPAETAPAGGDEAAAQVEAPAAEASPAEQSPAAPEPKAEEAAPSAAAQPARDSRGKQEIQQVMADNRDKVRACYDAALAQNPGIAGDLVVDFTIDPRGDVKAAEVNWSQSEIHIPELDTCAADAVRSLKFPPSSRGLESKVSYPFNFNPPRQPPPGQSPSGQAPSPARR
jgi:TonB family protein